MEGVTILAENVSNNGSWFAAVCYGIIGLLLLCFTIFLIINKDLHAIVCGIFCIVFIWMAFDIHPNGTTTTKYKVTVDESVSFVEFVDNYEIISRDGEIFTVEPIDKE